MNEVYENYFMLVHCQDQFGGLRWIYYQHSNKQSIFFFFFFFLNTLFYFGKNILKITIINCIIYNKNI